MLFQGFHEFRPRFLVLAFGGKEHAPFDQVGEHGQVFMPLAHAHLIDADAADVAEVRLGIGRAHLPEEHPPQPRVRLADQFAYFAHGHFTHEQQGEGFKLLGEVRAQPLPGRAHPENVAALAALAAGQPAGDLAAMLEDIEMPPGERLGVVVAKDQSGVLRTAD